MRLYLSVLIFLTVISSTAMAQFNFDAHWKKVEEFDKKGLPKSALEEVNVIYKSALQQKNDVQLLKALVSRLGYVNQIEENEHEKTYREVNDHIASLKAPAKNVLLSLKAQYLWSYKQEHRWLLRSRTNVAEANDTSTDIEAWGDARFNTEIASAYAASLEQTDLLKKTDISAYDPLINKGENSRHLRPTLYDLLVHRALDYYKTGENSLSNAADQFELTDPVAFSPLKTFVAHHFEASDKTSQQYKAILLLQDLMRFHADNKTILLNLDVERISYMNTVAVMTEKEQLYVKLLEEMEQTYNGIEGSTDVTYLLAQYHYQKSNKEGERNPAAEILLAKALCEKAINLAPASNGGVNAASLLGEIKDQDLSLETELANLPGMPFRTLVTYRNINKIYLRVARIDEAFKKSLRDAQRRSYENDNLYWKLIKNRPVQKSWEQALPGSEDFRSHTAEIKIDALPIGQYMVLASYTPDFSLKENLLAAQFVFVSEISYIGRGNGYDEENHYYTLHRQTGKPLADVKVTVWQAVNNRDAETLKNIFSTTSAKDGSVNVKSSPNGSNTRMQWTKGDDEFFPDDYKYSYTYKKGKEVPATPVTYLFTDRAIYRPGQTLYFKGLVFIKQTNSKSVAVAGHKATIDLIDVNGDKVDSIKVTTNEYGSYSGNFRLPEGRLNGNFRLQDNKSNQQISFSVEEYKRPKFFVTFDPVEGSYRLNDSVHVTGKATAFSGNSIDNAKVKFRVKRTARFPYPWLMWGKSYFYVAPREIVNGEATTQADGSFKITFPALPDLSVDKTLKPIFSYVVEADVTDLNGETHSGYSSVSAGYQSIELNVRVDSALHISSRNLNGMPERSRISFTIKPLQHPGRLLRDRFWSKPDQFVMSEPEYVKNFPLDIYKDEDKPESWKRGAALVTKSNENITDSTYVLDRKKLQPGWYEVEVTTVDKYGETIVQKENFELTDDNLPYPKYLFTKGTTKAVEPGETAKLLLGSSAKNVYVIQSKAGLDDKLEISSFEIDGKITDRSFTVKEEDRGNIEFVFAFVKDNRFFTHTERVYVPWTNKTLDITLATHRDKLLPGEKEKWQVNIKGYKKEQVAAEMLATMYDASLDEFRAHYFSVPSLYPTLYSSQGWNGANSFKEVTSTNADNITRAKLPDHKPFSYDELVSLPGDERYMLFESVVVGRGVSRSMAKKSASEPVMAAAPMPAPMAEMSQDKMKESVAKPGAVVEQIRMEEEVSEEDPVEPEPVQVRKNFNETAFFLPDLRTDKDGNISFEFTLPEALTRWHFMGLAHTKDAAFSTVSSSIITQKPLMVQPNAPRFMREGDKIEFSAKISNMEDSSISGEAHLELIDATTLKPVDGWFQNVFPVQHFTVQKGQSAAVVFPVQIPYNFNSSLTYRIVAKAGKFSDGEENVLPVLTNSMLVTETMPLAMRGDGTKSFNFARLAGSGASETLQQHSFTLEFTGNPAWYAVQALPYLMEYPYECSEQVFSRYYANTLASYVANKIPGIKDVFAKWKTEDTAALQSNLQKNEELKAVLLQETPWVLDAKNEAEQKRRIALLFDLQRMAGEQSKALTQLKQKQLPSGAFPWFSGMWEDRYITQLIVAGFGRLKNVGAMNSDAATPMINKAIDYIDSEVEKEYKILKNSKVDLTKQHIGYLQSHYLYMHSLYPEKPISSEAYKFYLGQAKKYWLPQNKYTQAMLALALQRSGDASTAKAIIHSLKENSVTNEEMGMYWKDVRAGYWWYEAPIETQAILIEAFEQVTKDTASVADMKTWLLKNKQTNNWNTTKATADAVYAMLLGSGNWLAATPEVTIKSGNTTISSATEKTQAGTGYFKKRIESKDVKPEMGKIDVTVKGSHGQPSWGAAYWQYFEQLDKITFAATPLNLKKQLFIQRNSSKGPVLTAIESGNELKVGDKVKVQVTMKVDRDMEYVHLKDMRAACFEPENVISANGWQNGVSYYQSTKDASTNFFFSRLPKGTYVFEYTMFVTHQGDFSNGISSAQCMYAPEFSAHSEGIRVKVK
jgi:uncharacterized protein YfaS (alpha-2-macroglobulin family)